MDAPVPPSPWLRPAQGCLAALCCCPLAVWLAGELACACCTNGAYMGPLTRAVFGSGN